MFFVIRLKNRLCTAPDAPRNTSDPDNIMSSELMDARDSFLTMCRERHWEFSSLRRATYRLVIRVCYKCNNVLGHCKLLLHYASL